MLMKVQPTLLGAAALLAAGLTDKPARADLLPDNLRLKATLENGVNLDGADGSGALVGWNRGGSDGTFCLVSTMARTVKGPAGWGPSPVRPSRSRLILCWCRPARLNSGSISLPE